MRKKNNVWIGLPEGQRPLNCPYICKPQVGWPLIQVCLGLSQFSPEGPASQDTLQSWANRDDRLPSHGPTTEVNIEDLNTRSLV